MYSCKCNFLYASAKTITFMVNDPCMQSFFLGGRGGLFRPWINMFFRLSFWLFVDMLYKSST